MLHKLLASLGVDPRQLLALVRVFVLRDLRQASVSPVLRRSKSGGRTLLSLLFFYFLVGLSFVPMLLGSHDLLTPTIFLLTYAIVMVGSLILIEYHTVVLSPEDYQVLGHRPLLPRTFFCAKVINLLFYMMIFTGALALPAAAALVIGRGDPGAAVGLFVAVFMATCSAALVIVLLYATILEKFSDRRLQNLLAWFQILLAFVIYSGFLVVPWILKNFDSFTELVAGSKLLLFYPPTWFASYAILGSGNAAMLHWYLSIGSSVLVAGLFFLTIRATSDSFSDHFTTTTSGTAKAPRPRSRKRGLLKFLILTHEERVVSKLILNQFMHDNKFKMAVLGILPMTAFYLIVGVQRGSLPDPFHDPEIDITSTGLLYLLVFLFPMMLRTYVTQSDSHASSWIFYALPVNIQRIVIAEKNFLMLYFVLPFLFILGVVFSVFLQDLQHVLLHMLVLGLLAHLFLQLGFIYSPDLPFSRPNVKGQRTRSMTLFLVLIPFLVYLGLPAVFRHVYTALPRYIVFVAVILGLSFALEIVIKIRVRNFISKFEFMS